MCMKKNVNSWIFNAELQITEPNVLQESLSNLHKAMSTKSTIILIWKILWNLPKTQCNPSIFLIQTKNWLWIFFESYFFRNKWKSWLSSSVELLTDFFFCQPGCSNRENEIVKRDNREFVLARLPIVIERRNSQSNYSRYSKDKALSYQWPRLRGVECAKAGSRVRASEHVRDVRETMPYTRS